MAMPWMSGGQVEAQTATAGSIAYHFGGDLPGEILGYTGLQL